jgi:hypothetical protein
MYNKTITTAVLCMALAFAAGCDHRSNPVSSAPSISPPSTPPTSPPPSAIIAGGGTAPRDCATCLVGPSFGWTANVRGFTSPNFRWGLYRFDRLVASGTNASFAPTSYLPGTYRVSLLVFDAAGRRAADSRSFSVRHVWWNDVPWRAGYKTLSVPSDLRSIVDKALVLVELAELGYSWLWHDWCSAEFQDPVTGKRFYLFNRLKRVRFENNMRVIVNALVRLERGGIDNDWWSGNATHARHWYLATSAADRALLRKHVLLSVTRIDYPPQFDGDVIHYYGQ